MIVFVGYPGGYMITSETRMWAIPSFPTPHNLFSLAEAEQFIQDFLE